ncbi:MAG: hypothetical protein SW833_27405 [Cyanobacteriota bacterium]|nr:hypothetical protein [Cyanobacteriota bacterium]
MISTLLDRIGEWNSQLFRELKGRLKPRNVALTAGISLAGQLLLYLFYQTQLPGPPTNYHRYCVGNPPPNFQGYRPPEANFNQTFCLRDATGHFLFDKLNWELWWLDIFTGLSFLAIFVLLVGGVYLLVADLSNEERRGTFGFIRLSPQAGSSILLGKILGVPILLYLLTAIALPLHLYAAIAAHISLPLVFGFYGVLATACFFFYSAALLYGLVSAGLGTFQAWVGSAAVLGFLWLMALMFFVGGDSDTITSTPFDWFILLSPTTMLTYVVSSAPHSLDKIDYGSVKELAKLTWFDLSLFGRARTAIPFILGNFAVWTYWAWQGLQRRYDNPNATVLTKQNSYWLSGSVMVSMMGFAVQSQQWGKYEHHLYYNFGILLGFALALSLGLTAALSPHRQTLQDWARYRHQNPRHKRNLLRELIWGEKSPATLAIALNWASVAIILSVGIVMLPFKEYRIPALSSIVLTAGIAIIYASIAQWMLMMKVAKRGIWAAATVTAVILLPVCCFALFGMTPHADSWIWSFSALPMVATETLAKTTVLWSVLGQWTAIVLLNSAMTRQLRQAGESSTKALERDRAPSLIANS